ncbi:MAG: helical backbone metal receptor [bacterium]|nr:helical backbone metal receptor [bacterium]
MAASRTPSSHSARVAVVLLLALLLAGGAKAAPRRVVSLVPSLTETVAALGAADRLVGRSRYCSHPAAVERLPAVGGYLDPSWEAVVALRPDLLLLTPESREARQRAEALGIPVAVIAQDRLAEVLAGMEELGRLLGLAERGRQLADSLRRGLDDLARGRADQGPPARVLLVADRAPEPGPPRDLWVIGRGSWLADLLEQLGARNAAEGLSPAQPLLSREGVARLDPDWILELWPAPPPGRCLSALAADWRAWPELRAVRAGQVRALGEDCLILPGPRLLEAARMLASLLAGGPDAPLPGAGKP